MKHKMPELPYGLQELAPKMSEETLNFHYGKHLQAYIDNLNRLIVGTPFEHASLEETLCKSSGPIFNNAAQVWNHDFFFQTLTPRPKAMPERLRMQLEMEYGSVEKFREALFAAATGLFGSGWVWLAHSGSKLAIVSEPNAGNPLTKGMTPLLTIDVWEHAYYIDYRNRRADYLNALWNLIDWTKVDARLDSHLSCNIYI